MKAISIKEVDKDSWGDFVKKHSTGYIFQTPEMYDVYDSTKNYTPFFVGIVDKEDRIIGVLVSVVQKEFGGPLGGFSSRCVAWGGPIIKEDLPTKEQNEVLSLILEQQNKTISKKAIYMQFRNLWDTNKNISIFKKYGYEYEDHLDIIIDLKKGEDVLWKEMNKKRRNAIRNAEKQNLEIKNITDKKDVSAMFEIYKDVYKNAKVPLSDASLFISAHNILYPKNMICNLFAIYDKKPIGAISVLTYKKTMYDWYAGGIIEFRNKHPNDILPWEAMKWGISNGYEIFDFGGAGNPNEEYGVRDFKKKYGGSTSNFGRYERVFQKTKMKIAMMGLEVMKKVR